MTEMFSATPLEGYIACGQKSVETPWRSSIVFRIGVWLQAGGPNAVDERIVQEWLLDDFDMRLFGAIDYGHARWLVMRIAGAWIRRSRSFAIRSRPVIPGKF